MTHLPYIAAAYGLAGITIVSLSIAAALRLGRARRQLAALDLRHPPAGDPRSPSRDRA